VLADNRAGADGGAIGILCANLPNLRVGADVIFFGNRASAAFQINPADIPLYNAQILTRSFTSPFVYGYNNYDIGYATCGGEPYVFTADVSLSAVKSAEGAPLTAGAFSFGVFDETGALLAVAQNDASGDVIFPTLSFTEAEIHSYTIRELTPSGGGWTTDDTVYPVLISVTEDEEGNPVAEVTYPDGFPAFTNLYETPVPTPAYLALRARKIVCGTCLVPQMFTFGVFDQNGVEVARAKNDGAGTIIFPALTFPEADVYTYTIRERNPSGCGWTTDTRVYPVIVTVTENEQGGLQAVADYPNGLPTFINRYTPSC
jgi:pilin isopeptide linkage protein